MGKKFPVRFPGKSPHFVIKTAAPSGEWGQRWGDWHFALSLASSIHELGYSASVVPYDEWYQEEVKEDVVINLRGLKRYHPRATAVNLLWVISHPDEMVLNEYHDFDYCYVAGHELCRALWMGGMTHVELMYQCTDSRSCHQNLDGPYLPNPIFIGNAGHRSRRIVHDCLGQGIAVDVYGGGWEGKINEENILGPYVENKRLGIYYAAHPVVLNDHWPDMAGAGIISNRIFDSLACGTPVITDTCLGISKFQENGVFVYRRPEELRSLIEEAKKFKVVAPDGYTFKDRAKTFVEKGLELYSGGDLSRRVSPEEKTQEI